MQITEVKVGELIDFIESEQYKQFSPKPITGLRAISQYHNPDARVDDTALIIAHENTHVLGFVGLLSRNTNDSNRHVFSNTCWWVKPEEGKSIGLPLFLMALKKCDSQMYLADCTSHTKLILEKTGYFRFPEPQQGIRGFLRFYIADLFAKKYKNLQSVKSILTWVDAVFNFCWSPVRFYLLKKYQKNQLDFKLIEDIDEETERFIKAHSQHEFIGKSSAFFEWVRKYPWIKESAAEEPYEYPFTHLVTRYSLEYFVLMKGGELKAFVTFSVRDNLVKIPFVYFDEENLPEVMQFICWHVLKKKYDSMVVFHPVIVQFMEANKMPFIYRKNEQKITGASEPLNLVFSEKPFLQDGDGDFVFS